MKKPIYLIVLVSLILACNKKTEVQTLADKASGNYTINGIKRNTTEITNTTGSLVIKRKAADIVDIRMTLTAGGKSNFADILDLTLKADGNDIDIFQDTNLIGTVTGKDLLFYLSDDKDTFEIKAKK
jgi:hypothetical protein